MSALRFAQNRYLKLIALCRIVFVSIELRALKQENISLEQQIDVLQQELSAGESRKGELQTQLRQTNCVSCRTHENEDRISICGDRQSRKTRKQSKNITRIGARNIRAAVKMYAALWREIHLSTKTVCVSNCILKIAFLS